MNEAAGVFTPWVAFADFGLAAALLLVGQLARARFVLVQRLFLPASVVGGLFGLTLGPGGLGWLPFSPAISIYPGVLIAIIFAGLALGSATAAKRPRSRSVIELWAYSTIAVLLQWGVALLLCSILLRAIWPALPLGFGALLASGFVGGHGTAAAVGSVLATLGWDEAMSLAMTSATIGIFAAVVGGMAWARWGAEAGHARHLARFTDLPAELRSGWAAKDAPSLGRATVHSASLDSIAFHLALLLVAAFGGYVLGQLGERALAGVRLPVFSLAFVVGLVFSGLLLRIGAARHIDGTTISHLNGAIADLLVVFGISSIDLVVVARNAAPLALLLGTGILLCGVLFGFLAPRVFRAAWFEKGLFTWGWVTGVVAMGIALLRIVDPQDEDLVLDEFALAYLFVVPVELGALTVVPQLLYAGHELLVAVVATLAALALGWALVGARSTADDSFRT